MRFHYDSNKAAQAAAFIARLYNGEASLFRIVKLIYLADRAALTDIGRTITGDRLVNMPQGGVPSHSYNALNLEDDEQTLPEPWSTYLETTSKVKFRLRNTNPDLPDLSPYELGLLRNAHSKFGYMPYAALVKYLHDLPEYRDPQGSSHPIEPADILRHENRSEDDIKEFAILADEAHFISTLALRDRWRDLLP